jgi:hypothetical protein
MNNDLLWHYTTEERLDQIVESGWLNVSRAEKQMGLKKPAIWFSRNKFLGTNSHQNDFRSIR